VVRGEVCGGGGVGGGGGGGGGATPLQDIRFFIRGLRTNQYYSWYLTPPSLPRLHFAMPYCAMSGFLPIPLLSFIQHTMLILVLAIYL